MGAAKWRYRASIDTMTVISVVAIDCKTREIPGEVHVACKNTHRVKFWVNLQYF